FVHGQEEVDYLRERHKGLAAHHFFEGLEYATERPKIASWAPLLVKGRAEMPVAATKMDSGTDVNFGTAARKLLWWLETQPGCGVATSQRVVDLKREGKGWQLKVRNKHTG